MDAKDFRFLVRLYADIVRGFSKATLDGRTIFIRHSSLLEQSLLEEIYERHFAEAVAKGVSTEAQRLKFLAESKEWTPQDDSALADMRDFLEGLEKSKRASYLKRDIEHYNRLIEEESQKVRKKQGERMAAIGTTAESFARKKMADHNIYLSLFRDQKFTDPTFDIATYEEMESEDFFKLERIYYDVMKNFVELNLKRIGVSPFFQNIFHLAEGHADKFYGLPVIRLTFYQADLFSYGTIFKRILDEHRATIPPEIVEDPEKVLDWYSSSSNLKKIVGKHGGKGRMRVFGATSGELRDAGVEPPDTGSIVEDGRSVNLEELTSQKG